MADRYRLTSVEEVIAEGSWLFTVLDEHGSNEEVILVPCEDDDRGADDAEGDGSVEAEEGDGSVEAEEGDGAVGDDADGSPGVEAWINRCTHEAQRLHRGEIGAILRDGEIVCPKHGSLFDACSGYCDNGEAAETTLVSVDVTVEDGQVYLTDDDADFLAAGRVDDDSDDDGPSSTSHLQL